MFIMDYTYITNYQVPTALNNALQTKGKENSSSHVVNIEPVLIEEDVWNKDKLNALSLSL